MHTNTMYPPYYYKVVVGLGTQLCTLIEVWVLGVGMGGLSFVTNCSVDLVLSVNKNANYYETLNYECVRL
jgi:hypothetical protein